MVQTPRQPALSHVVCFYTNLQFLFTYKSGFLTHIAKDIDLTHFKNILYPTGTDTLVPVLLMMSAFALGPLI